MDTTIYILGIILATAIAILIVVALVATAKTCFILVVDYWKSTRLYKRIKRKGLFLKLAAAASALNYWSRAYRETQDMNLVQMYDFYIKKAQNPKTKEK